MPIHRLSPADLLARNAKIGRLYRQGISLEMIGQRYGLAAGSVSRILGRLGEKQAYMAGYGNAGDVRYLGCVD